MILMDEHKKMLCKKQSCKSDTKTNEELRENKSNI